MACIVPILLPTMPKAQPQTPKDPPLLRPFPWDREAAGNPVVVEYSE